MSADQLRTFRATVNDLVDAVMWSETHPGEWRRCAMPLTQRITECKAAFRLDRYEVVGAWPRLFAALHRAKDERLTAFGIDGMAGHAERTEETA